MNIGTILDWVLSTGPLGFLSIVVAVAVFFARPALERRAKGFLLFSLLAFLPFLLGLASTAIGNYTLQETVTASAGSPAPEELERGQEVALRPTWLGGALTVLLLLVGVGALATSDDPEETN